MGDRSNVILEKSRTVRRRYQRRKQQVVFSKAELERIERLEERDRRVKKLQDKEKRRAANKKKRLEKEATAREERRKSGLPDPNASKVPSSQQLLSNFFGKKAGEVGSGGDNSLVEEEGDTEVDTDNDCESYECQETSRQESLEVDGLDSDDNFDDDDALSLFNDESVLREMEGVVKSDQNRLVGEKGEPLPGLGTPSTHTKGSMPQPQRLSQQASEVPEKKDSDQLTSNSTANGNKNTAKPDLSSKVNARAKSKGHPVDESSTSKSARIAPGSHTTRIVPDPLEAPVDEYQDAEDIFAGLCTQDFEDDDENKESIGKPPSPCSKPHNQQNVLHAAPIAPPARSPLRNIAQPLSVTNNKNSEHASTSQFQAKAIAPPQLTTTLSAEDDFGSFSFSDEDLQHLGV